LDNLFHVQREGWGNPHYAIMPLSFPKDSAQTGRGRIPRNTEAKGRTKAGFCIFGPTCSGRKAERGALQFDQRMFVHNRLAIYSLSTVAHLVLMMHLVLRFVRNVVPTLIPWDRS
jgi:hypothetical protein